MPPHPTHRPNYCHEDERDHPRRPDRRPLWKDFQWSLLSISALVTVALGVTGFLRSYGAPGEVASLPEVTLRWLDALYDSIQLFVLEFDYPTNGTLPWELQVARFMAPAISVFAALKALLMVFQDQVDLIRLRLLRGHVIVCGLGDKGLFLVEAFRRKGHRVVAIDRDKDNPHLTLCRETGSPVLMGDSTHPGILRKAGVKKAGYVIAVLGKDSANAEVAVQARRLVRRRDSGPLTCVVQVNDPELWMLLREEEFRTRRQDDWVRLEFFNIFETAARVMLDLFPPFLDDVDGSAVRPHLVLVGLGRMGQCVLIRAARDWRRRFRRTDGKPLVTVMDLEPKAKLDVLCTRHPDLGETVEIDCRQTDVRSPEFVQAVLQLERISTAALSAVYVCLGDDSLSLVAALAIQLRMRERGQKVPIVARVSDELGLARLLPRGGADVPGGRGLRPFGLMDRACSTELLTSGITETMARALHAVYLESERARGTVESDRSALHSWEKLPEYLREQNREQADSVARRIADAGFQIAPLVDWDAWDFRFPDDVVERFAKAEHDRWRHGAERSGYRWGAVRDEHRRESPNLVDWDHLPEADKEKDREFVRRWPETLFLAGLQIEKADPAGVRR